jgi:hypothetical protein
MKQISLFTKNLPAKTSSKQNLTSAENVKNPLTVKKTSSFKNCTLQLGRGSLFYKGTTNVEVLFLLGLCKKSKNWNYLCVLHKILQLRLERAACVWTSQSKNRYSKVFDEYAATNKIKNILSLANKHTKRN